MHRRLATTDAKKVLVIDDERPILMTLEALLSAPRLQVEAARTAAPGLTGSARKAGRT